MLSANSQLLQHVLDAISQALPIDDGEKDRLVASFLRDWVQQIRIRCSARDFETASAQSHQTQLSMFHSAELFTRRFLDDEELRDEIFSLVGSARNCAPERALREHAAILAYGTQRTLGQIFPRIEMHLEDRFQEDQLPDFYATQTVLTRHLARQAEQPSTEPLYPALQVKTLRHYLSLLLKKADEDETLQRAFAKFSWPFWMGIPDVTPLALRTNIDDSEGEEFLDAPDWRGTEIPLESRDERRPGKIIHEQLASLRVGDWFRMLSDHFEQDIRLMGVHGAKYVNS